MVAPEQQKGSYTEVREGAGYSGLSREQRKKFASVMSPVTERSAYWL